MPKELRVSVTASLPDDLFDQADVLSEFKPLLKEFKDRLANLGPTFEVKSEVVAIRSEKEAAKTPRAPKPAKVA